MKAILFLAALLPFLACAKDTKHQIRKIIKSHVAEVRSCLPTNVASSERGKLVLTFEINNLGKVNSAIVNEYQSTFKNSEVTKCIIDKLKSWDFPAAPSRKTIWITYPFFLDNNKTSN
ncbi:AgmX/PglI C-terminal domain-containing protein [Bdellovibrio sp. HCB-110]|uniref:AgmX/PglI C-terminal domain-containing protein n=1 Tax=Bdellovibrio sp. HCB-110 TaxID=3391182 RepID=UPI0039B68CA7